MMSPLREAVIAALEAEIERIESVRGAWRADAADRHALISRMLDDLREAECIMTIDRLLSPSERIRLK